MIQLANCLMDNPNSLSKARTSKFSLHWLAWLGHDSQLDLKIRQKAKSQKVSFLATHDAALATFIVQSRAQLWLTEA